jgi:aminoglycoside phosphotransferase
LSAGELLRRWECADRPAQLDVRLSVRSNELIGSEGGELPVGSSDHRPPAGSVARDPAWSQPIGALCGAAVTTVRVVAAEDLVVAPDIARAVVESSLGDDPGPLVPAASRSANQVFLGEDVVVKILPAGGHSGLHREIALAPMLPPGITAPLLASGEHDDLRYACFARMPGESPGLHLPGADASTAKKLAEQAIERLDRLHAWQPTSTETLVDEIYHGGFTGRVALQEEIERLERADADGVVPAHIVEALRAIANRAPDRLGAAVVVHGDCDWENWLADGDTVTALLDFESARLAEPIDDWFFLIRFSGSHMDAVLDVVTEHTAMSEDELRAGCELRNASYVLSDVRLRLEGFNVGVGSVSDLVEIVDGRYWWSSDKGRT